MILNFSNYKTIFLTLCASCKSLWPCLDYLLKKHIYRAVILLSFDSKIFLVKFVAIMTMSPISIRSVKLFTTFIALSVPTRSSSFIFNHWHQIYIQDFQWGYFFLLETSTFPKQISFTCTLKKKCARKIYEKIIFQK